MGKTRTKSRPRPSQGAKYPFVLVRPTVTLRSSFPKIGTGIFSNPDSIVEATDRVDKNTIWISETARRTDDLAKALMTFYASNYGAKRFGNLITLEKLEQESLGLLSGWFDRILGALPSSSIFPKNVLAEVLQLPEEKRKDLFIGGTIHLLMKHIVLFRGDLSTIVVPFSMFPPSPNAKPDFRKFSIGDYGNTLRFGNYESTADVVLWAIDADYRKRMKETEKLTAKGLGPALRRLRIQRGLSQSDFRGISRKTISRIENGEIGKPQKDTIGKIAKRLGVKPNQIETY